MSLKLMTWVFHESTSKGIDKLVLLAIADHAHDDGVSAYPGMTLLAKKAGVGKGTICRAIERLVELGELEVTDRQTTARAEAKIGRGAKLAYRILTAQKVPERNVPRKEKVPQRNDKKVPERNDTGSEGSADAPQKVPLTSPPIEEEPSSISEPKEHHVEPAARPDVDELCVLLADRIIANGGSEARYRNKPASKAWRDPMRRLLDLDGITPDRVQKAIDWSQADDFWRGVILSPDNLRRKFDQLRLAAQRNGYHPPTLVEEEPPDLGTRIPLHDMAAFNRWADEQLAAYVPPGGNS